MSLIDMRLMSERHQMSDGECKVLEGLFRQDINSPIISEGLQMRIMKK